MVRAVFGWKIPPPDVEASSGTVDRGLMSRQRGSSTKDGHILMSSVASETVFGKNLRLHLPPQIFRVIFGVGWCVMTMTNRVFDDDQSAQGGGIDMCEAWPL